MKRKIIVKNCGECPFYQWTTLSCRYEEKNRQDYNRIIEKPDATEKEIKLAEKITPNWCPLPIDYNFQAKGARS